MVVIPKMTGALWGFTLPKPPVVPGPKNTSYRFDTHPYNVKIDEKSY